MAGQGQQQAVEGLLQGQGLEIPGERVGTEGVGDRVEAWLSEKGGRREGPGVRTEGGGKGVKSKAFRCVLQVGTVRCWCKLWGLLGLRWGKGCVEELEEE